MLCLPEDVIKHSGKDLKIHYLKWGSFRCAVTKTNAKDTAYEGNEWSILRKRDTFIPQAKRHTVRARLVERTFAIQFLLFKLVSTPLQYRGGSEREFNLV